jgi:hypothetical protein
MMGGGDSMEIIEELKEKTEEAVEETPAADFMMGILLMALSAVICYAAWSWPRPEGISSAPGLFPFCIAITLFFMALGVFINALRLRGHRRFVKVFTRDHIQEAWARGNLKLAVLTLATVLTYMVVILNILSFEIGTFIYMVGSLYLFWRGKITRILIISGAMVAFYSVMFKVLFKLVLPGTEM